MGILRMFSCRLSRIELLIVSVLAIGCGLAFQASADENESQVQQGSSFSNTKMLWKLSRVNNSNPGQVLRAQEGIFTRQYVMEAEAQSGQNALFSNAHFRLSMDVFKPTEVIQGQEKDRWYVQGRWTLASDTLTRSAQNAGELTGVLSGHLQTNLLFDPTLEKKPWKGNLRIPPSRVRSEIAKQGVRPLRGEGEFVFDGNDEGSLSVSLKLWPKL